MDWENIVDKIWRLCLCCNMGWDTFLIACDVMDRLYFGECENGINLDGNELDSAVSCIVGIAGKYNDDMSGCSLHCDIVRELEVLERIGYKVGCVKFLRIEVVGNGDKCVESWMISDFGMNVYRMIRNRRGFNLPSMLRLKRDDEKGSKNNNKGSGDSRDRDKCYRLLRCVLRWSWYYDFDMNEFIDGMKNVGITC